MGNQNQKPQQETFTCKICFTSLILPNKKFKNSNKCVHSLCTDCIQKYVKLKVDEENESDIKCPAINCTRSLEPLSCQPILTHQVFNKWCDALCESFAFEFPRVYCPNKQCSELILNECGDDFEGRRVCPYCRKPFCFRCMAPWRNHHSCTETTDENEAAFIHAYKINNWKRCPNCGHCIERVSGCDKITCRCGTDFDYESEIVYEYIGSSGMDYVMCLLVPILCLVLSVLCIIVFCYPAK